MMDAITKYLTPTVVKTAGMCLVMLMGFKLIQFVCYVRKRWDTFKDCPFVGDFSFVTGTAHHYPGPSYQLYKRVQYLARNFRRYHLDWVGPIFPSLTLSHPDLIKILLKSSEPKPRRLGLGMSGIYEMLIPWLGEGLLLTGGKRWARNRRLLTPAFHFDILNPYVMVYNKAADVLLNKMEESYQGKQAFELFENITLTSLDILLQCAFSYNSNCQTIGEKHPYAKAVQILLDLFVKRTVTPWLYNDFLYSFTADGRKFIKHCDYVHKVAEDIICARKQTLNAESAHSQKLHGTRKYLDFLDILLTAKDENGVGMTDLEIRNEVDTFLFEGHDTTTSAICWILYSLAKYPDIQEQVYQEVASVMDDEEFLSFDNLQQLKYLTLCIKEGLRFHSPVPFVQRQITKEMTIDGFTVPTGTLVAAQIYELHHNPDVWDDPEQFKPERFLTENIADMDPFAFSPFSAGPRNCIGQNFAMREMKTVISRIIYRYQIKLNPDHEVRPKFSAVMKAESGIQILVTPRTLTHEV